MRRVRRGEGFVTEIVCDRLDLGGELLVGQLVDLLPEISAGVADLVLRLLSASGPKAQVQSAATQLQTAYKQTFVKIDCD